MALLPCLHVDQPPNARTDYCATSKWLGLLNHRRLREPVGNILPAEPGEERRCPAVLRELEALRRMVFH